MQINWFSWIRIKLYPFIINQNFLFKKEKNKPNFTLTSTAYTHSFYFLPVRSTSHIYQAAIAVMLWFCSQKSILSFSLSLFPNNWSNSFFCQIKSQSLMRILWITLLSNSLKTLFSNRLYINRFITHKFSNLNNDFWKLFQNVSSNQYNRLLHFNGSSFFLFSSPFPRSTFAFRRFRRSITRWWRHRW